VRDFRWFSVIPAVFSRILLDFHWFSLISLIQKNEVSESIKISKVGPHAKLIRILLGKIASRGHLKAFAYPHMTGVFSTWIPHPWKSMKIHANPWKRP
jgi:hypothetical protein